MLAEVQVVFRAVLDLVDIAANRTVLGHRRWYGPEPLIESLQEVAQIELPWGFVPVCSWACAG
jgi:hypothetical protein